MRPVPSGGFVARYVYRLSTIDDDEVVVVIGPQVEFTDRISSIGIADRRIWVGTAVSRARGSAACAPTVPGGIEDMRVQWGTMTTPEDRARQLVESLSTDEKLGLVAQFLDDDPAVALRPQPEPTYSPPPPQPIGLRLRIDLRDASPPVWRRLEISGDVMLDDFHHILQVTMGWTNSHLHRFHQGRGHDFAGFLTSWEIGEGEEGIDEATIRLDQVLAAPGDTLYYDYDFGDGWDHVVVVEAVLDEPPEVPFCVTGRGACPPEDCGGIPGYSDLAEWARGGFDPAANPGPLEAWEMRRWLPPGWHPDTFSVDEVNEALAIEAAVPVAVSGELAELAADLEDAGVRELRNLLARPDWHDSDEVSAEQAAALTEPYRLLLEEIGSGVQLTAAGYLPPKLVERFASTSGISTWWMGKANREDLTFPVAEIRETAQALGLVAKRKGQLSVTAAGRRGVDDPAALWHHIVSRLPLGRKELDRHAGWMALAVVGSGVPAERWNPSIRSLLGLLGWQTTYGNIISGPQPHSPTLSVLEILGGVMTRKERTGVNAALAATARSVAR